MTSIVAARLDDDMMPSETSLQIFPETAELERRVLAHERILQSLIAYMSVTEPRFVDHLREKFVAPMTMVRREHEHRDADDYAEEFIRAVMLLGEAHAPTPSELRQGAWPQRLPEGDAPSRHPYYLTESPDRVQVRERSGVWEVKVDDVFKGDYDGQDRALAAAALARLSKA